MAILSKEELLEAVNTRFKDDSSDETLTFIEDITDTLDSILSGEDWKKKYEENDASWRKKYRDRFFFGKQEDKKEEKVDEEEMEEMEETEEDSSEPKTYEELFEVKEEK